jgi:hypothetical protein
VQSVATGVKLLREQFPKAHNISVRYGEPKLPTFSERVRNIFLHEPLTTTRACVKIEVHGKRNGSVETYTQAIVGDAMKIITTTSLFAIAGLFSFDGDISRPLLSTNDVVNPVDFLTALYEEDIRIVQFEGVEN